jgi:iron complex outermembrane recepter protein
VVLAVACVLSATGFSAEDSLRESPSAGNASTAHPNRTFNIPAGDAAIALKKFSVQSGLSVMFAPERVEGVTTKEVVGEMSARVALDKLLSGTTLYAVRTKEPGAYAIRREGPHRPND